MELKQNKFARMAFIESRLFWEGKIQRKDLMDALGVSQPQATLDFKQYKELCPKNVMYDVSTKSYVPTKNFKPKYYIPNPYTYLTSLRQSTEGIVESFDPSFGESIPCESILILRNHINVNILKQVSSALKSKCMIEIVYQGMETKETPPRWVIPYYVFFDGIRWNIRTFCLYRKEFRTFTISRILEIKKTKPIDINIPEDTDWQSKAKVILEPNPSLSEEQQEMIALENEMENREKVVEVRNQLLPYFLLINRLYPIDEDLEKCGGVVVKNKKEIQDIIKDKPIKYFR